MSDTTLPENIAAKLRRDILRGDLSPGSPIKERDAAAEFGISRTPMREAIRILAKEGLVTLRPSRSPIVANPSWKEVEDNLVVLRALELLSGDLACRNATDQEIETIAAIQARMEAEADTIDEIDLFEVDMQFHVEIARASHNPVLAEAHRAILARLWRARFLGSRVGRSQINVFTQHNAMIEGLRNRDAELVRKQIATHLDGLREQIRQFFDSEDATGFAEDTGPIAKRLTG